MKTTTDERARLRSELVGYERALPRDYTVSASYLVAILDDLEGALARAERAEKLCAAARAWVEVPGKIDNHPDALDAEDALLAALESYLLAERDALLKERAEQGVVAP